MIDGQSFQYTLMGDAWAGDSPVITWNFAENSLVDATLGLSYSGYPTFEAIFDSEQKELIRMAFQAWEDVADIDFVETDDASSVDIRIGWDSIDGSSNNGGATLGQATVWSVNDNITRAAVQIDLADFSTADFSTASPASGKWSFLGTVTHEVGHTLGLDHSEFSSALMYALASDTVTLTSDDIDAIVAVYGQSQGLSVSQDAEDLPDLEKGIDPTYYLDSNPDVAAAGLDAVEHFNAYGWQEGRNPNSFFDITYYLTANTDISAAGINPLAHYLEFGWLEGRDPSTNFSTNDYLIANPDVQLAGINPLIHYLTFGFSEGRPLS
nr:matrixin family metalloprotease [uncultured Desulfobacter sp.]